MTYLNSVNNQNNNYFGPFQLNGPGYATSAPQNSNKEKESKAQEKRTNALGYEIAGSALVAGFGVLALMKGLPKGARVSVDRFFRYVDDKISTLSEKHKRLSMIQNITLIALRGARSIATKAKALFNLGPFKDTGIKHMIRWLDNKGYTSVPMKIFNSITKLFEWVSIKTSRKAYAKALTRFDDLSGKFTETNASILAKNPDELITIGKVTKKRREWIEEIEERDRKIHNQYREAFGRSARDKRLHNVQHDLENLDQEIFDIFYNKNVIKDKRSYQTFISEEIAAGRKMKHSRNVHNLRRPISNNIEDTYGELKGVIDDLEGFLDPTDRDARNHIKILKRLTEEYRNLHGETEDAQRLKLNAKISQSLKDLEEHINRSDKYDKKTTEEALSYVERFRHVLDSRGRGEVQEILTIYRGLLRDEPQKYKEVKKVADKATNALNNAISTETEKLFDKIRDLSIGCAPLDTLGLLAGLGTVGVGLGKADNNDERVSVGLKYGIPVLGTITTLLYLTAGLVSGGAAVAISLLTGVAINKVGVYLDNMRKQLKENPFSLKHANLPNLILNEQKNIKSIKDDSSLQPSN